MVHRRGLDSTELNSAARVLAICDARDLIVFATGHRIKSE